jgi:DNA-binding response OmpR family regulator
MSDHQDARIEARRIMVVEDDYLLATQLRRDLQRLGARVLGPFPSAAAALRLIDSGQEVDGATLDVTLGHEKAYAVADALRARRVPFAFVTGDDSWTVPDVYKDVPRFGKPVDIRALARALAR